MPAIKKIPTVITILLALFSLIPARSQSRLVALGFSADSMYVHQVVTEAGAISLEKRLPLISYVADDQQKESGKTDPTDKLQLKWLSLEQTANGLKGVLQFENKSEDTIRLKNVVPFGISPDHVYITGKGDHPLSRTYLHVPGIQPVNVIVPDNAWDLGFGYFALPGGSSVTSLVRRNRASIEKGNRTRFDTNLYPGGRVSYELYAETSGGNWQAGLTQVFQKRMLYDLDTFDNSLFERKDLQWIRHTYIMHLMKAWDKFYYDGTKGKFTLPDFIKRGKKLYGGDDVIGIWPTWPTLGLDQRNQFDLYRDLPGGTRQMRRLAEQLHADQVKLFVCYNPWDESTRSENHFSGISDLLSETGADGIILDTRGESSKELQAAADRVRMGVIMYSEGMAVPRDMPGIPSGRVHNALYYPPMLNLNKLIKPEFAIYRVAELYREPIRREFATSFFNGYGTELNIMAPGMPNWVEEQYEYLGRTSRILRENTYNFTGRNWVPLITTTADGIWVNKWPAGEKIIYTIYSTLPQGFSGHLFEVEPKEGYHFADLWHHRLLPPKKVAGKWLIEANTEAFNKKWLGTNNEGEVDCIARLPILIEAGRRGDALGIRTPMKGDEIRVWAGAPAYSSRPVRLQPGTHQLSISKLFDRFEGDLVIQLMDKGILLDETIVTIRPGEARRVSVMERTKTAASAPSGMVAIPAGPFTFRASNGDAFIPYPTQDLDSSFDMPAFFMDQFPVTNAQFSKFILASGYKPANPDNFLKHWVKGRIPAGQENFPVVYISYEDAKAYARWAGKRLPTEIEWQYAGQGQSGNEWPWKQETPVTRKIQYVTNTLSTTAIEGIDSAMCNLGDGKPYPVGSYRKGVNSFGLFDLVGSVWQLTSDEYMNGSFRYIILKGGSYFKPSSSWWYVQGGPRELHYRQQLLRVSAGFERNATVGFRCVKDANR